MNRRRWRPIPPIESTMAPPCDVCGVESDDRLPDGRRVCGLHDPRTTATERAMLYAMSKNAWQPYIRPIFGATGGTVADDIRAATRDRLKDAAERWQRIVTLKESDGGPELADARYVLHRIRCAINVLRSRAHQRYVTDEWLREMSGRRPASEIAGLIETMVPGGYPEPPSGRPLTKAERHRILSGELTVPESIVREAERLDALDNPPDDVEF